MPKKYTVGASVKLRDMDYITPFLDVSSSREDTFTETNLGSIIIRPGTIDQELNFGGITTSKAILLVLSEGDPISIKIGTDMDTSIPLTGIFLLEGKVSKIYISKSEDVETTSTLDYYIIG